MTGAFSKTQRPTQRAPRLTLHSRPYRMLRGVRKSQAVSYASAFFQLDGFAVPAPARVSP